MSTIRINKLEDLAGNNGILVSDLGKSVQSALRVLKPALTFPTIRDNGSPLQVGDIITNLTDGFEYRYTGVTWVCTDIGKLALEDGSRTIGWKRLLPTKIDNVGEFLSSSQINLLEFSKFVTVKPNPLDPSTWDWSPAFVESINAAITFGIGKVVVPKATYSTSPIYFTDVSLNDLEIDFQGSTVKCIGPRTKGTRYDWEYGIFTFHGKDVGPSQTVTLATTLQENSTDWEVTNSSSFSTGDYWVVEIDPDNNPDAGGNFSTKKVWRLLQCTNINSSTSVSFDYSRVFKIDSGTKVKYTKVDPVKNIKVKNVNLIYSRSYIAGDPTAQLEASSGITFLKAVNCSVENVTYSKNPKQVVHFEFSHGCDATRIEMIDPIETTSGGYCVQFEKSIYFEASKCRASKDRHLFDATASSNGKVSGCSGFNSTNVNFTTHGTWEHDILYEGNTGGFQLAGSGIDFGQTALRITVRNHSGTSLNASTKVSDLTIESSRFVSIAQINLDGLYIHDCEFLNDVRITKITSNSKKLSRAELTYFTAGANFFNVTSGVLTLEQCTILEMLDTSLAGTGELILLDCEVRNTGTSNIPLSIPLARLEVHGGIWSGVPISVSDSSNQVIIFEGCDIELKNRPNNLALVISTKPAGTFDLLYAPRKSTTTGRHVTAITSGGVSKIQIRDTELVGGTIRVDTAAISTGWFMRGGLVYNGCTPTFPTASTRVGVGVEITI